jgi:tripartite-type tricarboxylate transporter receptor subunit TctC
MKLSRRRFLPLVAAAGAAPAISRAARAQAYPSRPVRLVVGFPPGGATDIVARIMGQWLSDRLGQSVITENRPSAGSNLAAQTAINAPPDGYTLLVTTGSNAVNATFYDSLPFNFLRDIEPVAGFVKYPLVLVADPTLPVKTTAEFIAFARTNGKKLSMASFGTGTSSHLSWELLKMMTGINLVHVPYRGEAPALTDLLAGQVQVVFATAGSTINYVRAGTLQALAVTSGKRMSVLPEVPTVAEFLPDYEATSWAGIAAPSHTPADIVARLNQEINATIAEPKIDAQLTNLGATVMTSSPTGFADFIAGEIEKWAKVIKFANIKAA